MLIPPCSSVRLEIGAPDLDTRRIAGALRNRWERNHDQDGYFVSISFYPVFEENPEMETFAQREKVPFDILAGREYGDIIEKDLNRRTGI